MTFGLSLLIFDKVLLINSILGIEYPDDFDRFLIYYLYIVLFIVSFWPEGYRISFDCVNVVHSDILIDSLSTEWNMQQFLMHGITPSKGWNMKWFKKLKIVTTTIFLANLESGLSHVFYPIGRCEWDITHHHIENVVFFTNRYIQNQTFMIQWRFKTQICFTYLADIHIARKFISFQF